MTKPKEKTIEELTAEIAANERKIQQYKNRKKIITQLFTVIDSRYRSKKPLIVTTNLKLEEIKNPPDLAHARIYDRILERCAPVLFSGKNFREEGARATKAAAKEIVRKDNKV